MQHAMPHCARMAHNRRVHAERACLPAAHLVGAGCVSAPRSPSGLHCIAPWSLSALCQVPSPPLCRLPSRLLACAAGRLLERIEEAGSSGEAFNVHHLLGRMTMQVIGRTAFGWGGVFVPFSPCCFPVVVKGERGGQAQGLATATGRMASGRAA